MPGRALSADEFAQYAREQIHTADALLARHRPASRTYCHCDRPQPCSQAEAIHARKTHHLSRLGLAEPTVPLPIITATTPPPRPQTRLRALLSRLTRQEP